MGVRNEFQTWQIMRKTVLKPEISLELDRRVLGMRARLYLEIGNYYEAYKYFWHLKNENAIKQIWETLLRKAEVDSRAAAVESYLVLAECIALDCGYELKDVFWGYMRHKFWPEARGLAHTAKNSEWISLAASAAAESCLARKSNYFDNGYVDVYALLDECSPDALRKLYPSVIKSKRADLIRKVAAALNDEEQLRKLARKYFRWFGRDENKVRSAFGIWKWLGDKKGLQKVQRWAKRNLKKQLMLYFEVSRLLKDARGKELVFSKVCDDQSFACYTISVWEGFFEDGDISECGYLARNILARGSISQALKCFMAIGNEQGIFSALNAAIAQNISPDIGDLWKTNDWEILRRLKIIAINAGRTGDAEMYAEKLGQPLLQEDYFKMYRIALERKNCVSEALAKKAGITVEAADYIKAARELLQKGKTALADEALMKAAKLMPSVPAKK